eukprot:1157179-Pelagomonas_calceolata.AAC.18
MGQALALQQNFPSCASSPFLTCLASVCHPGSITTVMVSDDERSNILRERVESLNAFSEQKELPERGVTIVWDILRLYLENTWVFPNWILSVHKRHYEDQVLRYLVREHPRIFEMWPDQDQKRIFRMGWELPGKYL